MLIDKSFDLSAAQAVTSSAASTNIVDLNKEKLAAHPLMAVFRCGVAAEASGAATVTFAIQTCAASNFSSGVETVWSSDAIGKAALTADKQIAAADLGFAKLKRYVRAYYTVATGPLTAGKFDCYIAAMADMK